MGFMKRWTRQTARLVLIGGLLLLAGSVVTIALGAHNHNGSAYAVLAGVLLGAGGAATVMAARFLASHRGLSDEQIAAAQRQQFDERFVAAQGKAASVSIFVSTLFLCACALVYVARDQALVGWLFVIGALLASFGRRILTRVFLRSV